MRYCIRSIEKVVSWSPSGRSSLVSALVTMFVFYLDVNKKVMICMWVGGGKKKLSFNKLLSLP